MGRFLTVLLLALLVSGPPSWGWWPRGHSILSRAAAKALPEEVPEFFRSGGGAIAHCVWDPDLAKNRGTPLVRRAENPEHYLNPERLKEGDRDLPKDRYSFVQFCAEQSVRPEDVGFLPYAVAEWTQRLAVAFAEHRKWPENPYIQQKCLVYAGFIAHYAQDLCQPLHVTMHYDGRPKPDGTFQRTGIHFKVDDLVRRLGLKPDDLARDQKIEPIDDLMAGIFAQIEASSSLIDRVYEMEDRLPPAGQGEWEPVPEVVDFGTGRAREATRFTAALYLTAWRLSGQVGFESWVDRAEVDGLTDR